MPGSLRFRTVVRISRTAGIACLGLAMLTACKSTQVTLTPAQEALGQEVSAIDPWKEPLAEATPIIDVHTHTFNARYLPLQGILLGKRDALPPVTTLISDHCAMVIARGLLDRTELASVPGQPGIARKPDTRELRIREHPDGFCRIFLDLIDKAIAKGAWSEGMSVDQKMQVLDSIAADMNVFERMAVQSASSMMGMEDHTRGGRKSKDTVTGIQAAVRFLWTMTQNDAAMMSLYRTLHDDAPKPGPITLISHMMDLGPVYDQCQDGEMLLDFQHQQLQRMKHYQDQSGSGLLYFVAYNPYRNPLNPCATADALDLVRDAILHHGAKGVKVYPPSGYRPAGNAIEPRPRSLFSRYPGKQWDARYRQFAPDKSKALDAGLNVLLEWCIEHDVPVFTHSGHGEFEARKGYGAHHSDPAFWGQFLESHSTPGNPCKLRLCLGHAGGDDYWFGTGTYADWGRRAYELCTKYPNVYCEITTGEALVEERSRAWFVDRIAGLFKESAEAAAHATPDAPRYPFASKLMYGTDWYLPDQGKPSAVLLGTQKAFLHPSLKNHYADYFSGNARRYLKLER